MTDRDDIGRAAILDDETRYRLYRHVRAAREPVTREQAATALRISPALAAFHLEKLLRAGLLSAHLARPAGRSGPGAGRTAKYYHPSGTEVAIAIPARRYEMAGMILTEAIRTARPGERDGDAVLRVARRRGRDEGASVRGGRSPAERAERALARCGFEPARSSHGAIVLRNCPFRTLALDDPDLVCRMNRAFVEGVLAGAKAKTARAELTREPDACCVTVRP